MSKIDDGRRRAVVENVLPQVDCGRFPIKRTVGEKVLVEAIAFTDGHDALAAAVRYQAAAGDPSGGQSGDQWHEVRMTRPTPVQAPDRWQAEFAVDTLGRWQYTVVAWVDHFETWRRDLKKRIAAAQDITVPLQVGAALIESASDRAQGGHIKGGFTKGGDAAQLADWAERLRSDLPLATRGELALDDHLDELIARYPDLSHATAYERILEIVVDPPIARFGAWYEMFPRSCGPAGQHGTFKDCEARLPYVASMDFDVLYLPPIHPIGHAFRKGPNNSLTPGPDDPGSPWAIGSADGGHTSIHPALGTLADFQSLVAKASEHALVIALDIAFQCAPDHPWVTEHPEWFIWRPDGTVQYAENPPKKYQDIYPLNFESENWQELWEALKNVFLFWSEQGVHVFRVDNPHTKAFSFWEWVIAEVKRIYPETVFLSEAFTRPPVMHRLAKAGFTQSYNYFPWRNTKWELTTYLTELTAESGREYFRPNLWPNTPDILPEYLQIGGRPAFASRLVLAATMGASYGIYGPAFELSEGRPRERGSEEYLDSEKYQIRDWDLERPDSLRELIARVNQVRRENPALHSDWNLQFHETDNDQLIAYSKRTDDGENALLMVVNLDPHYVQSGWLEIPLDEFGLDPHQPYQMHDLLSGARYLWSGPRNYVEVDPQALPAHVFRLRRHVRTERDFDYFL